MIFKTNQTKNLYRTHSFSMIFLKEIAERINKATTLLALSLNWIPT